MAKNKPKKPITTQFDGVLLSVHQDPLATEPGISALSSGAHRWARGVPRTETLHTNVRILFEAVVYFSGFWKSVCFWDRLDATLKFHRKRRDNVAFQRIVNQYCEGRKAYQRRHQDTHHGQLGPRGANAPSRILHLIDQVINMEAFGNTPHMDAQAASAAWQSRASAWPSHLDGMMRLHPQNPSGQQVVLDSVAVNRGKVPALSDFSRAAAGVASPGGNIKSHPAQSSSASGSLDTRKALSVHTKPGPSDLTTRSGEALGQVKEDGASIGSPLTEQRRGQVDWSGVRSTTSLTRFPGQYSRVQYARASGLPTPPSFDVEHKTNKPDGGGFLFRQLQRAQPSMSDNYQSSDQGLLMEHNQAESYKDPRETNNSRHDEKDDVVTKKFKQNEIIDLISADDGYDEAGNTSHPASTIQRAPKRSIPTCPGTPSKKQKTSEHQAFEPSEATSKGFSVSSGKNTGLYGGKSDARLDSASTPTSQEAHWDAAAGESSHVHRTDNKEVHGITQAFRYGESLDVPELRYTGKDIQCGSEALHHGKEIEQSSIRPIGYFNEMGAGLDILSELTKYQTKSEAAKLAGRSEERLMQVECSLQRIDKLEVQLRDVVAQLHRPCAQNTVTYDRRPPEDPLPVGGKHLQYLESRDVKPFLDGVVDEINKIRSLIRNKIKEQEETDDGWTKMNYLGDVLWTLDSAVRKAKKGFHALDDLAV
ncbi:hypothetical protein JX265_010346 [Neoarthrinium moseri]|uniref:Uncharacterized protein n=1 Tax=Neoarthrinium moseri TaxID=1658444 RepID=A0A9P9WE77_9PEZI|nr:hypothetical protein JX265_010346 [Neoarthrinium moseri]